MPFDPTLPLANSNVVSAVLRNQFNGLKEIIDEQAALIAALQAELALVPPGPAQIVDFYSPDVGELHLEITSNRATGMIVYRKGPSDDDFVEMPVSGLVWDTTGLESGVHTIKAAGTNTGGTGPVSATADVTVG